MAESSVTGTALIILKGLYRRSQTLSRQSDVDFFSKARSLETRRPIAHSHCLQDQQ